IPQLFTTFPGSGRSLAWRAIFIALASAETVPVGLFLGLRLSRSSLFSIGAIALAIAALIFLLQIAVASAAPSGLSIGYHFFGIAFGAVAARSIRWVDLLGWRRALAKMLPAIALAYLIVLLLVNDVLTRTWRSPTEAFDALDPRGLLPF